MKSLRNAFLFFLAVSSLRGSAGASESLFQSSFESENEAPKAGAALSAEVRHAEPRGHEGEAHSGCRSLKAESMPARPAWTSDAIRIDPERGCFAEGWIKSWPQGTGWLQVRVLDEKGNVLFHRRSPAVRNHQDWVYVAAEISCPKRLVNQATSARMVFWVKGGTAALDDVALRYVPSFDLMNADFDVPLDKKGRFPYWNEEEDSSLLPGRRAGQVAQEEMDASGGRCAAITASGNGMV